MQAPQGRRHAVDWDVVGFGPGSRHLGLGDQDGVRDPVGDLGEGDSLLAFEERARPDDRPVAGHTLAFVARVARAGVDGGHPGEERPVVRAVPGFVELELLEKALLRDVREEGHAPTQQGIAPGVGDGGGREMVVRAVEVVEGEAHLLEVVDALGAAGRLARRVHGGQEQGDHEDQGGSEGSTGDPGDRHPLAPESAPAAIDIDDAQDAEDDRRDTREDRAQQRHQAEDQAGDRLAAGPGLDRLEERGRIIGVDVRLGDDQLAPAVGAAGTPTRVLIPGPELLPAFARDEDGHDGPLRGGSHARTGSTATILFGGPPRLKDPPARRGGPVLRAQEPSLVLRNSRARSSAAGTFSGFLPPAWARSGRPPPPPPTTGATSLSHWPACSPSAIRSGVRPAARWTLPSATVASSTASLAPALRRRTSMSCRRSSGVAASTARVTTLAWPTVVAAASRSSGVTFAPGSVFRCAACFFSALTSSRSAATRSPTRAGGTRRAEATAPSRSSSWRTRSSAA